MLAACTFASSVCTLEASTWASTSVAMRIEYGTWRGVMWWQASMPHSLPLTTIDTLIDACTPMFCKYST